MISNKMRIFMTRFEPGTDLKESLTKIANEHEISCGFITTICGSLKKARLRLPSKERTDRVVYDRSSGEILKDVQVYDILEVEKILEINAAEGTISKNHIHVHLSLNDEQGKMIGGHLLVGCEVFTTIELAILIVDDISMDRKFDNKTKHKEIYFTKKY